MTRQQLTKAVSILGLLLVLLSWGGVQAHTIRPAVITIDFKPDATIEVEMRTNLEALMAGIGPEHADTDDAPTAQHYNRLRELSPAELEQLFRGQQDTLISKMEARFDNEPISLHVAQVEIAEVGDLALARKSILYLRGVVPAGAKRFIWHFPAEFGSHVMRLRVAEEVVSSAWRQPGEINEPYLMGAELVPPGRWEVARQYGVLGFTHILPLGLDHILFVLGIFLLCLRLSPILWQVTAFTLAHTITLGMTIYGLIALPASIVEPLIAISIVYVGVENILVSQLKPWRIVIVFLFGLLHGMGFAGVLSEIGLPRSEFVTALITFNIGVELGQLAVILLALLAVGWFRAEEWYRQRVVIPLSALISLVGLYWTVERLI